MPLPAGVTTATVTFGGDTGFDGNPVRADLTFTPSVDAVHVASGQRLFRSPIPGRANFAATGSVPLPHTNQTGLVAPNGDTVTSFQYRVEGTYTTQGGVLTRVDRAISLPVGQTVVDLDSIPDETAAPPGTAPSAVVTSLAGLTGDISLEQLLDLIGGGTPGPGAGLPYVVPFVLT